MLAYSPTVDRLAVALGDKVFLWSESTGVINTPDELFVRNAHRLSHVTSLTFSSLIGRNAILAVARVNGVVILYSPLDDQQRFIHIEIDHSAVHCSFRPATTRRSSMRLDYLASDQEVLLIGDETGLVNVYMVEWPKQNDRDLFGWHGGFQRHAQLDVHKQQVCGIAWSSDGELVATGGNDNLCCLFDFQKILASPATVLRAEHAKHIWHLNAAVKAIAFCPWQRGLLAVGGGSNDRAIHFFHTISGAPLAMIDCAAQVTSLIWSSTKREIAATFGFAQPEHPYRIAVYAWPSCQQIVAIPWLEDVRALYAIGYPGGASSTVKEPPRQNPELNSRLFTRRQQDVRPPLLVEPEGSGERQTISTTRYPARTTSLVHRQRLSLLPRRPSPTHETVSIIVASSENTIKFHELWSARRPGTLDYVSATGQQSGLLGGSDILEGLHGIEREWEIIR